MSSRILTSTVIGIDDFMDHESVLARMEGGAVAVFANNSPAFYAITPERLAELLALESRLARPASDITLDNQFYEEPAATPVNVPMGKFAMQAGWQPDADFQRLERRQASPLMKKCSKPSVLSQYVTKSKC